MNFSRLPLGKFMNELGSAKPAPGGGAAAAMCAALGLSLFEMVLRINARKHPAKLKKAAKVHKNVQTCLSIMKEDAQAFLKISQLYKSGQKSTACQKALKNGAEVPYKIIHIAKQMLKESTSEHAHTSAWLKSDLVEAELLLKAAIAAAALNVEINLKGISDKPYVNKMRKAMR